MSINNFSKKFFCWRYVSYFIVSLVGFVAGWCILFLAVGHVCRGIEFSPYEITFISPVKEGELVNVPLSVQNKCSIPHKITSFGTSCNCTGLVMNGEKSVPDEVVLSPRQTLLLQATVGTSGVEGDRSVGVWAKYGEKDKLHICDCRINIHVLPSLRPVVPPPSLIRYEPESNQISQTIELGDAFPDSGIEIESVSTNLPDLICELQNIPDEAVYVVTDDLPEWKKRFRKRYAVKYSFDSERDSFTTKLVIKPKNERYSLLIIPINYEGSQKKHKVFPSEIIISAHDMIKTDLHNIEVRIVPSKYRPLQDLIISQLPENFTMVSKQKVQNGWLFQFTVKNMQLKNSGDHSIIFADENSQPCVTVPVWFAGSQDKVSN